VGGGAQRSWWSPRRISWWIGALFAVGATCFMVGALPGFVELVGSGIDAAVFFVGSIFFTTAAALQCREAFVAEDALPERRRRLDRWSSVIQLVGTVFFNVDTFRALQTGFSDPGYNRFVWAPDAFGSACFLVSGVLAYVAVSRRHDAEWRIALVNLLGCVAFGIAAVASFFVPSTGSVVNLGAANLFTSLGGLCFLIGAILLLPEASSEPSPTPGDGLAAAGP
jgi:hypothetical protein